MKTETSDTEPAVKTIDRAARMLWVLAGGDAGGLPLTTIVRLSGFGKGTAHRLLAALVEAGFAFQEPMTRRYRLGAGMSVLARLGQQHDVGAAAIPYLQRLAQATSDTVYASVREGPAAICVGREIGSFPIRTLSLSVGDKRPLGVGSGSLALLSFLPAGDVHSQVRSRTPARRSRTRSCEVTSPYRTSNGSSSTSSRINLPFVTLMIVWPASG